MVGTSASIPTPAREARPDALPVAGHHSLQPRGSLEHSNLSLIPGPADRGGQPSSARKSMLEGLVITKTQLTALSACPRLTLPTMYWSKAVSWQGVRRAYWPVMHVWADGAWVSVVRCLPRWARIFNDSSMSKILSAEHHLRRLCPGSPGRARSGLPRGADQLLLLGGHELFG